MRVLALDTALDACAVAVLESTDGTQTCAADTVVIGRGHAEYLVDQIDRVMAQTNVGFADLDRITVTIGPGSFTGIRIGIAMARGFAVALGIPSVGVGTLEAIAADLSPAEGDEALLVVLDARRDEVYAQAFSADGAALAPPHVASLAEAAREAGRLRASLAGSGADLVAACMIADGLAAPRVVSRKGHPDIATVARLGAAMAPDAPAPHPLYIRAADAKPQTGYALPHATEMPS